MGRHRAMEGPCLAGHPFRVPGELEAYLEHPESLPFAGETLEALADRMAAVDKEARLGAPPW